MNRNVIDTEGTGTREPTARVARKFSAALGGWLFLSAFLWKHSLEFRLSDAIVGAVAMVVALGALYVRPNLHVVNIVLSSWLFVALAVFPGLTVPTLISDLLVASLLFGFSVIPDGVTPPHEHHQWPT
jgi:hypothetical protein